MTLHEVFQRIIRAHLVVIGVCAVVPVLLVVVLQQRQATMWSGSVRIQVVSSAPSSTTEADAVSSRVLALATTPTLVSKALDEAGMEEDPTEVAQHHVSATRLGESPVVDVAVTSTSAARARALASALVEQVVTFMNSGSRPALDAQLSSLDTQISQADDQRRSMTARIPYAGSDVQRQALIVRIQAQEDRLNQLSTQRASLLQAKLAIDQAVVIDGDNPEVREVASTLVPRSAIALVLGLMVGLALAVLMETLAPRLAGIRALGRTLSSPVLGRTDELPADLAASITLAARRQGVETVVLMGVDGRDESVADALLAGFPATKVEEPSPAKMTNGTPRASMGNTRTSPGGAKTRNAQRQQVRDPFAPVEVGFTALASLPAEAERTAGVVVVSHGSCRLRDVDALRDRLTAMRWPVVGIVQITHRPTEPSAP